jgi:hypothetical protein
MLSLAVIRTRSRAKTSESLRRASTHSTSSDTSTVPHRYTQVPLPAKILKLLVNSWQTARRGPPGPSADELADGARTPDTDDDVRATRTSRCAQLTPPMHQDGEWDDEEGQDGPKGGDDFLSGASRG